MIRRTGTCFGYSSIAQWQSIRLLIEGLLVRVQLEEPHEAGPGRFSRARLFRVRPAAAWMVRWGAAIVDWGGQFIVALRGGVSDVVDFDGNWSGIIVDCVVCP